MASGQFIYPRDSDANVDFQYLDLVNVSWTASGLGNLDSVALTLYLMSNGESGNYQVPINASNFPHTGWTIWPLNFVEVKYPAIGHFGMSFQFQNGTIGPGPNVPLGFNVVEQSNGTINCWNCSLSSAASATEAASTARQTMGSNSSAAEPDSKQVSDSLSAGAGAGIAIGVIAAIAMVGATIFWCYGWSRRRKRTFSQPRQPLLMPSVSPDPMKKYPPQELTTRPTMREMMASPIGRELPSYSRYEAYEMDTRVGR